MSELIEQLPELLPYLTAKELAELDRLSSKRPEWAPLPGPQTLAYQSKADDLLYGGAAGGGKTDLLLGLAKREHSKAIIFRRIFPSLRGIIDRSRTIYNPDRETAAEDSYNESLHRWKFRQGRTVRFGSIQYEKDKTDWQGQDHDFYGFDEITEFTETQFRYVTTWNRTARPGQRCRVVCTSNPPTDAEGEWVISYWAPWLKEDHPNPALPGELRWFTMEDGKDVELPNGDPIRIGGVLVYPRSRTFIPARVEDNPYLVQTGYIARLQALPEPLRSKMLYGDFKAGREDSAYQVIPSEWVKLAQERWKKRPRPTTPLSSIGVDVARGGKDRTALAPRYDNWFDEVEVHPGQSTPDGGHVAALVVQELDARDGGDQALVNIDIIGVGTSPFDYTRDAIGTRAVAMNGGKKSNRRDKSKKLKFRNKRAEWYWRLREALDPKVGDDLALPPDPELKADLCAPTWKVSAQGIQVEAKEDIIERIGRSPDKGDAVVYAHATDGEEDLEFLKTMATR